MLGNIVNFMAIIIGSFIGLGFKKGIPERISSTIMHGLALCVIYIGISGVLECTNPLELIISVAIGGLLGELIDIDKRINNLGVKIEERFKSFKGKIAEGFVTSSLLFCVGAMAIVGALESGLTGDNSTLYAKSVLDGISSIIFTSTLGIGVIFSAFSVIIYQGIITIASSFLGNILVGEVITSLSSVGSLLILGLGLNMLGVTKIKVANLLPGVIIPIIFSLV